MPSSQYPYHQWADMLRDASPQDILAFMIKVFGKDIAFASSMGVEDQVITAMLAEIDPSVRIFTLDTGRLFPEVYDLIQSTNTRYNINIEVYFPDYHSVEKMTREKGVNLFYESIENRKLCCHIRKVEPLKRAMAGLHAWISGIRKDQSLTRQSIDIVEWDESKSMVKINPLANWSESQVWEYIRTRKVPYNPLHDKSYPSIGCQPCTRAIMPGEDVRAGRWWWENPYTRECGLHISDQP